MRDTTTRRAPSPLAQSAAAIRQALKADVKDGTLVLPAGAKISVRIQTGSLYSNVLVGVIGAPERWTPNAPERSMLPEAALAARLIEHRVRKLKLSYSWGAVQINGRTAAHIAKAGFVPGED